MNMVSLTLVLVHTICSNVFMKDFISIVEHFGIDQLTVPLIGIETVS